MLRRIVPELGDQPAAVEKGGKHNPKAKGGPVLGDPSKGEVRDQLAALAAVALAAASLYNGPPVLGCPRSRSLSSTPCAVRKRLERERKDDGALVIRDLVVDDELLDGLIEQLGWVGEWDRTNAEAVGQAILDGLREAIQSGHA